jgi:thymidine phosphorylase
VADEQMSALAMAIVLNGMNRREISRWTSAMIASGERMDFSGLSRPTVDKHSTGGVGDKITLPLAPLVAACGAAVPQLSGRGLGHTGGTLDKLESIPGWRALLSNDEMLTVLRDVGAVVCAAGDGLAPADKKLYALRDVTGTVEAIPLIASSIMSKKIAEGASALVLDVKTGSGAFMKDPELARELARTMVELGNDAGVHTTALITAMDVPLGRTAGNAIEVTESVEVLAGGGPPDVRELTLVLARTMLGAVGLDRIDPADALDDGRAMDAWKAMIRAQGGDPDAPLPLARESHEITAVRDGVVTRLDAFGVGVAAWRLGAGRARKEDPVQAGAGVRWHVTQGERVRAGQPLATLYTDTPDRFAPAMADLTNAFVVGDAADVAEALPLVVDRIGR